MSGKQLWTVSKQAASDWSQDNATRLAAALAFYTMLSIAPLLIICIKICGLVFNPDNVARQVHNYAQTVAGAKAAQAASDMIANATKTGSGLLATIISLLILVFSASGVFGELQSSLNTIWEVKPKPNRGFWGIIEDRLFSFAMVMVVAFLLLVSMVVSTAISGLSNVIAGDVAWLWQVVNFCISIIVITGLIALMFKYIPDVRLRWGDVIHGAIFTAVLFTIGKFLLGWYLGRGTTTSVYGAAGSLVALLLWVYYSSLILFFGAEFTQAYGHMAHPVQPTENARPITAQERMQQGFAPGKTPAPGAPITLPPRKIEQTGWSTPSTALLTAGGAVAGAVLAAVGMRYTEVGQSRARRRLALQQRLEEIESHVGDVNTLEHRVRATRISDHLAHIERQIKRSSTLGDLYQARSATRETLRNGESLTRKLAQSAVEFVKGAVRG
jgi:membrane protein